MKYFFSYGDDSFELAKKRIFREAQESGFFDVARVHGPEDIPPAERKEFQNILSQKKGGGYFLWKTLLIKKYFDELKDGDFLIYIDSGCTINKHGGRRFQEYLKMLKNSPYGIISFAMDCRENHWTTKELFEYFNLDIMDENINRGQYVGGILIIKKCPHSLKIIDEIIRLLKHDPHLITDKYNDNQNDFFIENRHDQSILSLVCKKYGSIVLDDETDVIPFGFLRRAQIKFIGKRVKKPGLTATKQSSPRWELVRMIKPIAPYIRLLIARLFRRKFPFWATRLRG